ncbi:hypothetical protein RRG08_005844, partial [Elysia crispata]
STSPSPNAGEFDSGTDGIITATVNVSIVGSRAVANSSMDPTRQEITSTRPVTQQYRTTSTSTSSAKPPSFTSGIQQSISPGSMASPIPLTQTSSRASPTAGTEATASLTATIAATTSKTAKTSTTTASTTTTTTTTSTSTTSTIATTTTTTTTTAVTTKNPLASSVYSTCSGVDCQMFSDAIKASRNASVSPCDSYHDYACGARVVSPKQPSPMDKMSSLQEMVSSNLYKRAVGYLNQLDPSQGSDNERVSATLYQACMMSNTAEPDDAVFGEVAALLADLDLSPDLTLPLSFDLLLRRAQDKFGVNPFLTIQRVAQFDGESYQYATRASVPSLTFPAGEYSLEMQSSQPASLYIDTLAYVIRRVLETEAASSGGRRRRDTEDHSGGARRRRR